MFIRQAPKPETIAVVFVTVFALTLAVMDHAPAWAPWSNASAPEARLSIGSGAHGLSGRDFRVIDGDTVVLRGERIRIANIDTPETGDRAGCHRERALAAQATRTARRVFQSADQVSVHRTGTDRYGRTLARVRVDGRDFGGMMISDGLAQRWRGRQHEWCR